MRVICISDRWLPKAKTGLVHLWETFPVKGEIYLVLETQKDWQGEGYLLQGFPGRIYNAVNFRELDDTFGPAVCERIEEMIEYETVNQ